MGEQVEVGEADLRDIFEENEETLDDPDEERGPEANEKQLKKLELAIKKLTDLRPGSRTIEAKLLKEKAKGPQPQAKARKTWRG